MNIHEALVLCKQGKKVRPVDWRTARFYGCWVAYRPIASGISSFVEVRPNGDGKEAYAISLYLRSDAELLGEWEIVEERETKDVLKKEQQCPE